MSEMIFLRSLTRAILTCTAQDWKGPQFSRWWWLSRSLRRGRRDAEETQPGPPKLICVCSTFLIRHSTPPRQPPVLDCSRKLPPRSVCSRDFTGTFTFEFPMALEKSRAYQVSMQNMDIRTRSCFPSSTDLDKHLSQTIIRLFYPLSTPVHPSPTSCR